MESGGAFWIEFQRILISERLSLVLSRRGNK